MRGKAETSSVFHEERSFGLVVLLARFLYGSGTVGIVTFRRAIIP